MAIKEYLKNGKTVFKVYVQTRGKTIKRIRLQKALYEIESEAVARREEKRLIKELAEKLAKLEGKGLFWSEVVDRWETEAYYGHLGLKLHRYAIRDHVNRLKRYTRPWRKRIVSELTRADGRQVLAWAQSNGTSHALLNKIKHSINLVYTWGVEEGLIQPNGLVSRSPIYGISVGDKEEKIQPILTLAEFRKFLLEAKIQKHPWYPIWAFASCTGMRSGELMALEWGDIDETNGIIRVSKSYSLRLKAAKCTKSGKWRNVDVSSQLLDLIRELRRERGHEAQVLRRFTERKYGFGAKVLRLFIQRIGINKPIVFHTLRACWATHLLSTGIEPLKVMRMGGWSDLKTFQIYLRLSGVDVKGVAEGLDVLPARNATDNVIPLFS